MHFKLQVAFLCFANFFLELQPAAIRQTPGVHSVVDLVVQRHTACNARQGLVITHDGLD